MEISIDDKIDQIHKAITELASGNLNYRSTISHSATESDAVLMGLNMLAEELVMQRKQTKTVSTELHKKKDSLELVFNSMDDDLALIDLDKDRIVLLNKGFEAKLNGVVGIDEVPVDFSQVPFSEMFERMVFFLPDQEAEVRQGLNQVSAGIPWEGAVTPLIGNSQLDMHIVFHPLIKPEFGKMMLWVCKDLTYERLAHKRLLSSERSLKEAERISHIGHWTFNLTTQSIVWSDELCKIFNVPVGSTPTFEEYMSFVHPDDRELLGGLIQECLTSQKKYDVRHRILYTTGEVRYLECRGEAQVDRSGAVSELIGTALDVTDSYHAEQQIRESEKRLEMALMASNTGIFDYEFKTRFLYLDPIACSILGLVHDVHSSQLQELYAAIDLKDLNRIRKSFEAEDLYPDRSTHSDSFMVNVKGSNRNITLTAKIIRSDRGYVSKLVGTIRDITLQVRRDQLIQDMNSQLERSNRDLKLANAQLEEITHVTSHDMKAPLLNIGALVKLMRQQDSTAVNQELIDKLEESINRMKGTLKVVSDVLEVQFNKSIPSEEVEFSQVWNNVLKEVENQIKESGIEVHADFENAPKIWYPRFHLNSILLNLLTNAIKYAKPSERPRIRLKTETKSNRPHLTFSDDGIGIDLERHGSKLFKLFKRFHDHVPGRGVGLHIVYSIVNSHGGYIDVESEVNKGTTFKILLLDEDE